MSKREIVDQICYEYKANGRQKLSLPAMVKKYNIGSSMYKEIIDEVKSKGVEFYKKNEGKPSLRGRRKPFNPDDFINSQIKWETNSFTIPTPKKPAKKKVYYYTGTDSTDKETF